MSEPIDLEDAAAASEDVDLQEPPESTEALFERNMEAFRRVSPPLYEKLSVHRPVSQLVEKDNGEPSVVFNDFDLYPEGSRTAVDKQLRAFGNYASRLMLAPIRDAKLDLHSDRFKEAMERRFDDSGFHFSRQPLRKTSYFAVVLGVGLGHHLREIAEMTDCRVLAIVEPNLDFIYHSLSVIDWTEIFERFKDRGAIYFHTENDPWTLVQGIKSLFRGQNPSSLDGTHVFRHYQSAIFREIDTMLHDELRTAVLGLGFFQDEVNMIGQTYKNLEDGEARIMRKVRENPGLPAFLVGSGPSLNALIPFLKENADNAVIFSCGTSIDVLKSEGIEPDFWVMMERSKKVAGHLEETRKSHDISQIRFVGSTTIFPTIPKMFRESILFFRPGLSPAPLFARSRDEIAVIPDPMAANAAVSFALSAGFAEIYLLGIDCGSPRQEQAHAKGSMYDPQKGRKQDYITDLNLPTKGNFGGTVWTTSRLQWSRENIERLIRTSRGHVFFNLGTGALVKGATPKHPRAVSLAPPPRAKSEIIDDLVSTYPVFTREAFDDAWEHAAVIDRLPEYCEELKAVVKGMQDVDAFSYIYETMRILKPAEVPNAMALLLRGTLFTAINVFEYYANRLADEAEFAVLVDIFKEEYCRLVDEMCERAVEIFMQLEDGMEWADEFVE